MSQQLQDLIEKIKKDGVDEASALSRDIEMQARKKAEQIIAQANQQAQEITLEAQAQKQKLMDATQVALKQAARDMLLNLRKEIKATLENIIAADVQSSLTSENLARLIEEAVRGYLQNATIQDIILKVNSKDLKVLQNGFLSELQTKLKQNLTLKPSDSMAAGFTISFDSGKSFFDFTDKSLAEYLAGFVNVQLALLLKETVIS